MVGEFFGRKGDAVRREVFDEMLEEKNRIITIQAKDMESLKREIVSLKEELYQSRRGR